MAVGIGLQHVNLCHQYLHLQVLGRHCKKPTLANSCGKFCGKQPAWLLRHYPAQLVAEIVALSRQRMLRICYVNMSNLRHFCYRMCYVLPITVHVHSVFFSFAPSCCMWSPKAGSLYPGLAVRLQSTAPQLGSSLATQVLRVIKINCTQNHSIGDGHCWGK